MISWPPPVGPGGTIGVAALSGAIDPTRLERGLTALADLGFGVVAASNLTSRWNGGGFVFAGDDAERLDAFHALLEDDRVEAVMFARGGHGLLRILDRLDWDLIGRRPRLFVGYSDLTPFLLQIVERFGWVALHGPMAAADLARGLSLEETDSLLGALGGRPGPVWDLAALPFASWNHDSVPVEGMLLGGCLSLLNDTVGTSYAPQFDDAIVFWEEVSEPSYRVDRMLRHLVLSGSLARASGMVVGHVVWPEGGGSGVVEWPIAMQDLGQMTGGPVGFGLHAGHVAPNLTLPLGCRVRLDSARRVLEWIP